MGYLAANLAQAIANTGFAGGGGGGGQGGHKNGCLALRFWPMVHNQPASDVLIASFHGSSFLPVAGDIRPMFSYNAFLHIERS